jgi:hypothetical protein
VNHFKIASVLFLSLSHSTIHLVLVKVWFCVCLTFTFNNNAIISWWSVLLVEETRENNRQEQVTDTLYHIMLYTSLVIGTDCICSCKSNYHTTTALRPLLRKVSGFVKGCIRGALWMGSCQVIIRKV